MAYSDGAPTAINRKRTLESQLGGEPRSLCYQAAARRGLRRLPVSLVRRCPQRNKAKQLLNLATRGEKFKGFVVYTKGCRFLIFCLLPTKSCENSTFRAR